MHTERLEKLASFLDSYDGPIKPDMDVWARGDFKRYGFLWMRKKWEYTHACAIGLAALTGAMKEEGVSAIAVTGFNYPVKYFSPRCYDSETKSVVTVDDFFGIDEDEFTELFTSRGYSADEPSFKEVAAKIRMHLQVQALLAAKPSLAEQVAADLAELFPNGNGDEPVRLGV